MELKNMPLGVFDSGLGGLTALKELKAICPGEDIVYFGDTGRVPYGSKSAETIKRYAVEDARFLKSFGVKAILVACGTVSANAMNELKSSVGDGVMGVIEPTVDMADELTEKGGTVLILGTEATIASKAYEKLLAQKRPDIKFISQACPLFVPLAENGYTSKDNVAVKAIVNDYVGKYKDKADTVILGCTHYPLLYNAIADVLPNSKLISSGAAAAYGIKKYLEENNLSNQSGGKISVYVSDKVRDFEKFANAFLGESPNEYNKIDIEDFLNL